MSTTTKPRAKSGKPGNRGDLRASTFAFPKQRKEPLTNGSHVRNALARFDQVKGVSDADRDRAFARIKKAAKHFGVSVGESHWRQLGGKKRARKRGPG